MNLKDVQNETDHRNIAINKVGISDLKYPITVKDRQNQSQHTVALVNMYVDLPHHYRGTHMSRFIEVIERYHLNLGIQNLDTLLSDMKNTFECQTSHIDIRFPYFVRKKAPVSGIESLMEYQCRVRASKDFELTIDTEVQVPVNNLCPCSKEISDAGAHNQRGIVSIRVQSRHLIWFEELIEIAENSSSTPLFTLLKRNDEKYITEHSYNNPRFVEDAAREVAVRLNQDSRIDRYSVEVTNYESIHNHNAYACISSNSTYQK